MQTLRKYTLFFVKIHSFALIFSFLFQYATPQNQKAFAQDFQSKKPLGTALKNAPVVDGEFLVRFKTDRSINAIEKGQNPKWFQKLGSDISVNTSLKKFKLARVKVANPAGSGQWENLANILSSDPDVESVTPNHVVYSYARPNDTHLDKMWYAPTVKAQSGWDQEDLKVAEPMLVAVIDTGMDQLHPDLRHSFWNNPNDDYDNGIDDDNNGYVDDNSGWNFYEGGNYTFAEDYPEPKFVPDENGNIICTAEPYDRNRIVETHGSHVVGSIAADRNNNKGIAGISQSAKIMALKALGGPCGYGTSFGIIEALFYAVENGAKIINMSLGSYGTNDFERTLYKLFEDLDVLIVVAAGNEGNNNDGRHKSYPASYTNKNILSVAATNEKDELAIFSNYGKTSVDIAAPGVEIFSTIPILGENGYSKEHGYIFYQGTSMATPIVTGAAALIWSQRPELTAVQVKQILMDSVDKIPSLSDKVVSGGRLNIAKALRQAPRAVAAPEEETGPQPITYGSKNVDGIRIFDKTQKGETKMRW
jgi:subtilisin family serine protease